MGPEATHTVRTVRTTLVGMIALACVFASGCGQEHKDRATNAWCGLVKQHHSVFQTKYYLSKGAQAQFLEIAKAAPPKIRPAVLEVREGVLHFYTQDTAWLKQNVGAWVVAIKRVDDYLERECNVQVPTLRAEQQV
jgi:hypothetical protein